MPSLTDDEILAATRQFGERCRDELFLSPTAKSTPGLEDAVRELLGRLEPVIPLDAREAALLVGRVAAMLLGIARGLANDRRCWACGKGDVAALMTDDEILALARSVVTECGGSFAAELQRTQAPPAFDTIAAVAMRTGMSAVKRLPGPLNPHQLEVLVVDLCSGFLGVLSGLVAATQVAGGWRRRRARGRTAGKRGPR